MRITIFTAGSQGDVQPCLRLGKGLQAAGCQARLAAPENFAALAQGRGVEFYPLRGDVQQIMAGETGRKFMASGGSNPVRAALAMRKLLGPVALQMAEDALDACREAEALVSLAVFAPFARTIAEIRGIPLILVEPTPLLPAAAFPAAGWPVQRSLGGFLNRLSGAAMLQMIWQWYGPYVNEFRRRFRLKALKGGDFQKTLASGPLLGAYSPTLIPHPADWPDSVHITGTWFQEEPPGWRPSPELEAFLSRGEPPVSVGFGSMGDRDPERMTAIVLEALEKCACRGVLLTGWGGLQARQAPENVLVLEAAPYGWLFPRMAAVVHHGGAGTTAEGLRAGVPAVIVPFIVDQPFWGKRVQALGAGPEPVPAKKLTAGRLAEAIQAARSDPRMKARAAAAGRAIRGEDGVGQAVKIIREYLGG